MQTSGSSLWIGTVLALLAGCTTLTTEQQALLQEERRQAYTAGLARTCDAYGFGRGTPAFAQCLLQLDQAETQRREQRRIAIMQHFAPRRDQREPDFIPPIVSPRSTTTTCSRGWLGTVHCQTP